MPANIVKLYSKPEGLEVQYATYLSCLVFLLVFGTSYYVCLTFAGNVLLPFPLLTHIWLSEENEHHLCFTPRANIAKF